MNKVLIILASFAMSAYADINVLWWNIGYNEYALPSQVNPGQTNLDDSLQNNHWNKYDIVSLGEFVKNTLNPKSLDSLKADFPYQKVIKYNEAYGKSIYLFSKTPFELKVALLDWSNPHKSLERQKKYKDREEKKYGSMATFDRKYIRLKTKIAAKEYNFVFYHLNNPWMRYKRKAGMLKLGYELLFGKRNPLYHQLLQLREALKNDLGEDYKQKNLVVMGDSNCPKKAKGLTPICYRLVKKILPLVEDEAKEDTFPAEHSIIYKKLPSVKIDHAQVSKKLKAELKVLSLRGSDHKALELRIDK
jgi:endonuclease/exonuclease/phosphatase family metal-dependent hydrolase